MVWVWISEGTYTWFGYGFLRVLTHSVVMDF